MPEYWFRNKKWGYGWVPASPEGWLVTLLFVAFIAYTAFTHDIEEDVVGYFIRIFGAVILLLVICFKTGEKPEWKWG